METLRNIIFWDNSLLIWFSAAGIAAAVFSVLLLIRGIVRGRLTKLAKETGLVWDDLAIHVVGKTKRFALLVGSVYVGSQLLTLTDTVNSVLRGAMAVTVLLQIGIWGTAAVTFLIRHHTKERAGDGAAITSMKALSLVVRLVLWSIVALLVLDNVGVDITALVAGLGVGGIAVALAVQNVLGDLFASLSIAMDKPFVNGDFIVVGDMKGSVEHVGLKTTRLRSLSGEELIVSNSDLLSSRIRNYGRMGQRRGSFTIGVTYGTPRDLLRKIPEMIQQAVEAQSDTRFDRSHFTEFGDSAIMFETVYHMIVPDYGKYMDVQQAINLSLHEQFEANGIEFAFPTRTVHIASGASQA